MKFCKRIFYLLVIVFLLITRVVSAQINDKLLFKGKEKKTDWEQNNLSGVVKSYREEFFVNDENIGFKRYYNYFSDENVSFNLKGFITSKKLYDKEGNVIFKKNFEYDTKDKLKSISEFDTNDVELNKTSYKYDPNNLLTESIYESKLLGKLITKYTYNALGNLELEKVYKNETIVKTVVYSLDANGLKAVIDSSLIDNKTSKKYKSKSESYDMNGNLLEQISYDVNGEILLKYVYKFDASNNNIEFSCYGNKGVLEGNYMYKFDTKNNMIEEQMFKSNKNTSESIVYEYKYDLQGNWIEKTSKHHNIPKSIVKRKFAYYM